MNRLRELLNLINLFISGANTGSDTYGDFLSTKQYIKKYLGVTIPLQIFFIFWFTFFDESCSKVSDHVCTPDVNVSGLFWHGNRKWYLLSFKQNSILKNGHNNRNFIKLVISNLFYLSFFFQKSCIFIIFWTWAHSNHEVAVCPVMPKGDSLQSVVCTYYTFENNF